VLTVYASTPWIRDPCWVFHPSLEVFTIPETAFILTYKRLFPMLLQTFTGAFRHPNNHIKGNP